MALHQREQHDAAVHLDLLLLHLAVRLVEVIRDETHAEVAGSLAGGSRLIQRVVAPSDGERVDGIRADKRAHAVVGVHDSAAIDFICAVRFLGRVLEEVAGSGTLPEKGGVEVGEEPSSTSSRRVGAGAGLRVGAGAGLRVGAGTSGATSAATGEAGGVAEVGVSLARVFSADGAAGTHLGSALGNPEEAAVGVGALEGELLGLVAVLDRLGGGDHVEGRRSLAEAVVELDEVQGAVQGDAGRQDDHGHERAELRLLGLVRERTGECVSRGVKRVELREEAHGGRRRNSGTRGEKPRRSFVERKWSARREKPRARETVRDGRPRGQVCAGDGEEEAGACITVPRGFSKHARDHMCAMGLIRVCSAVCARSEEKTIIRFVLFLCCSLLLENLDWKAK